MPLVHVWYSESWGVGGWVGAEESGRDVSTRGSGWVQNEAREGS